VSGLLREMLFLAEDPPHGTFPLLFLPIFGRLLKESVLATKRVNYVPTAVSFSNG